MRSELKEVKLSDLCDIGSSKRIFHHEYVKEGVPFFRSKEVIDKALGSFKQNELLYISHEKFNEIKSKYNIPKAGELLLSSVGNRSGIPYVIKEADGDFYFKDGNLIWFRNFQNLDSHFLYFWINSSNGQNTLSGIMIGSAQKALTISGLQNLTITIPPLPTQKKIAHILSTLDDKIELNRKMNQTLEAMAQAIFKSWFVDFDPVHAKAKCKDDTELEAAAKELGILKEILELFPSEFEESELGMIPKGWEWKKITKVCSTVGSGGTPKRKEADNYKGNINWFTTKELRNSFVLGSIEKITDKGLKTSSAKLFPINTVVMAIYAAPTVGRLGILTEESTFNQAACGFVADEVHISYEFLFLYLQDRNSFLNNLANGAAQQNLNVGIVKDLDVPIADERIMKSFKGIAENIFSKLQFNIKEISTLQKTRDTLLPKLLSGELDVSELEIL